MNAPFSKDLITTKDAGERSGYTSDYLSRLVRSGKIAGKKVGHTWLVDKKSLARFLDAQGEHKIDRARTLAHARAQEYRTHRSILHRATKSLTAPLEVPERFVLAASSLRSQGLALSLALAVVVSGAYAARVLAAPELTGNATAIVRDVLDGFYGTFGSIPYRIASRIEAAQTEMSAIAPRVAAEGLTLTARIAPAPIALDLSSAPLPSFENVPVAQERRRAISVLPTSTSILTVGNARASTLAAFAVLTSPSLAANAFADTYRAIGVKSYGAIANMFAAYRALIDRAGARTLALGATTRDAYLSSLAPLPTRLVTGFGSAIINATHAAIRADVAIAYIPATTAPKVSALALRSVSEVGRAAVAFIGATGDTLARAAVLASRSPRAAALALGDLSGAGPAIARAIFNAEYRVAKPFVAAVGGVSERYLAAVYGAGDVGARATLALGKTDWTYETYGTYLADARVVINDAYLGAIGKTALALDTFARAPKVAATLSLIRTTSAPLIAAAEPAFAAVQSGLSASEQAALATYRAIHGLINATGSALAFLFTPPPGSQTSNPIPRSLTSHVAVATSTPPAKTYQTYVTNVRGITQADMDLSLATLRTNILSTVAGMIAPVAVQGATNITTIQQINRIEKIGSLVVEDGEVLRGKVTSAISVSATTGTFTNLIAQATSLGATTVTGTLAATGALSSGTSVSAPFFTATSTTATSTFAGSLAVDTNTFVVDSTTGNVGIGTTTPSALLAVHGTSYVSGTSFFGGAITATSTFTSSATATSTFAGRLAVGTSTPFGDGLFTVGVTSPLLHISSNTGNLGIGTSTPATRFAVAGSGYLTEGLGIGAVNTAAGSILASATTTALNFIASGLGAAAAPAYTFAGDLTTGFWSPAASTLAFSTAGAERMRLNASGNVGIGTTTPWALLSVNPNGISGPAFVVGSSTATQFIVTNAGWVGIGTTSPSSALSVSGNFMLDGTTGAVLTGAGAGLTFSGTGNHDITASGGTLRIGSNTIIGNIEALDDTVDIGTPSTRFDKIYANEVNATTLVGTLTGGNLTAETFSINSDNATADTENSYLAFERGSITPNALLTWNAGERFEFNHPLYIENASASSTVTTMDLKSVAGQTADIFRIASSSGANLLNFSAAGNLGIASTTPWGLLSVNPNGITGPSFVVGSSTATNFIITNGGRVGIGTANPSMALHVSGTDGLVIPAGTTAERPGTLVTGTIRYNSETSQFEGYGSASWGSLGGVIDVDQDTKITAEDSAGADNDQLKFFTAGTERMRLDSNGNLGLATTSPFALLSLAGAAGGTTNLFALSTSTALFATTTALTINANGDLALLNGANLSVGGNLTIIGNTTHTGTLTQTGLSTFTNGFLSNASSTITSGLFTMSGGASTTALTVTGNTYFPGSGIWNSSGNVGIGTTSPIAKLALAGGSFFQAGGDATSAFTASMVGGVDLGVQGNALFVSDRYAFVAANSASGNDLHIYDITDPTTPVSVGGADLGVAAQAVYAAGHYAYVGTAVNASGNELRIFDIARPAAPIELGGAEFGASTLGMVVSGRYLYVLTLVNASGSEFKIYDIANPKNPVEVGSAELGTSGTSIFVAGRYAYVTTSSVAGNDFRVFDVSNPTAPTLVGGADMSIAGAGVYVSGRYAYVVTAAVAGNDLKVFDVKDPTTPAEVGGVDLGIAANGIYVSGRYAYLTLSAVTGNEFKIFDLASSTAPIEIGGAEIGTNGNEVQVVGKYAYVVNSSIAGNEFRIYDITGAEVQSMLAHSLEAGNLQVRNDLSAQGQLTVSGGASFGQGGLMSQGPGQFLSFATSSLASVHALSAFAADSNTASVVDVFNIGHLASSTASNGIGTGLLFSAQNSSGTTTAIGRIASIFTAAGGSATTSALTFSTLSGYSLSEAMRLDSNGNVGIGTTTPSVKFSVGGAAGDATGHGYFTGGLGVGMVNTVAGTFQTSGAATFGGSLTVSGLCVTGDTRLRRRRKAQRGEEDEADEDGYIYDEIAIKDIQEGDEIQSLDEKTGKLVWSKVKQLAYMGKKQTYRLTTVSGKTIRTTANHPYLARKAKDKAPARVIAFIDLANIFKGAESEGWEMDYEKLRRYLTTRYGVSRAFVFGGTSNRPDRVELHERLVHLGYEVLLVPTRYFKDSPPKADVDSRMTFEMMRMEKEYDKAVVFTSDGDFYWVLEYLRTMKEHVWLFGVAARTARDLKRLFQSDFSNISDLRGLLAISTETQEAETTRISASRTTYPFDVYAVGVKKGYPHGDELSMKAVDNLVKHGEGSWLRVSQLKEGMEVAIAGNNGAGARAVWEKIISVEPIAEEDVYDVEIEGTHNFIGNDIVAHNTALFNQASTTLLSANQAYFGGTATSTFNSAGALTLAAPLAVTSGGTGWANIQAGAIPYGAGAGALATTTQGSGGQVLAWSGGIPSWVATTSIPLAGDVGGTLSATAIGANKVTLGMLATLAANSVIGNLTGSAATPTAVATSSLFTWTGTGDVVRATSPTLVTPALGTPSALVLTNATGLPVAGGGTGASTFTANGVLYGNTANAIQVTAQGGANSILVANSGAPSFTSSPTIGGDVTINGGLTVLGALSPGIASTTNLSANQAWFGATATSTFSSAGALTLITPLLVGSGGTGAATLTGLLQGNGTGAITGITGTAGQFPYYNGASTLLATSTIFLSTSGNIGIGTSSPQSRLAVSGGLSVGADYNVAAPTNGAIIQGNVGIGTTSPSRQLTLQNISGAAASASGFQILSALGNTIAVLGSAASGANLEKGSLALYDTGTARIYLSSISSENSYINSGNVGIGTTSPATLLYVQKDQNAVTQVSVRNYTANTLNQSRFSAISDSLQLDMGVTAAATAHFNSVPQAFISSTADIGFSVGSVSNAMFIKQTTGNVGIGTTTPDQKLNVYSASSIDGIKITSLNRASIWFYGTQTAGSRNWLMQNEVSAVGDFQILRSSATGGVPDTNVMTFDVNGNVGIGTTAPAQQLDISKTGSTGQALMVLTGGDGQATESTLTLGATGLAADANQRTFINSVSDANAIIAFQVNSSEKMRINNSGNVGIGTTGPVGKLDIQPGSIGFVNLGVTASSALNIEAGDGAATRLSQIGFGYIGTYIPGAIGFETMDGVGNTNGDLFFATRALTTDSAPIERMRITAAGNIGIGTTTPASLLQIGNPTSVGTVLTLAGSANSGEGPNLTLVRAGVIKGLIGIQAGIVSDTSANTAIYSNSNNVTLWGSGTLALTALSTGVNIPGNVGIGTAVPGSPLDVVANSSAENMRIRGRSADGIGQITFKSNDGATEYGFLQSRSNQVFLYAGASAPLILGAGNSEQVRITSTGNVGIGTTNPQVKLQVDSTTAGQPIVNIQKSDSGTANQAGGALYLTNLHAAATARDSGTVAGTLNWFFSQPTSGAAQESARISAIADGAQTGLYTATALTFQTFKLNDVLAERMRIDNQGNVGIGTTSPDMLLSVGSATPVGRVAHFENSTGSCYINPTTTALECTSDARRKSNVNAISTTTALADIEALSPVFYNWNSEMAGAPQHAGFIAQQVQPIFPDLVSAAPDGFLTMNYAGLTPYLTAAIQALAAKIEPLAAVLSIVPGVESQCVTGDTKLRRRRRRSDGSFEFDEVDIKDIAVGDEIQSLDEATGTLVWSRVKQLAYMGKKQTYKLTTASGKTIRTTANHPYLARTTKNPDLSAGAELVRAIVLVDYANIKAWARSKGVAVDLEALKILLSLCGIARVSIYYGADVENKNIAKFMHKLRSFGYEVVSKPIQYFRITLSELLEQYVNARWVNALRPDAHRELVAEAERLDAEHHSFLVPKANFDVEITMNTMRDINEFDHLVLFSGDGDFAPLISHLKVCGKQTTVVSGREFLAGSLHEAAHIAAKLEDIVKLAPGLVYPLGPDGSYKKPTPAHEERVWENCVPSIADLLGLSSTSAAGGDNPVRAGEGSWRKVSELKEGMEIAVAADGAISNWSLAIGQQLTANSQQPDDASGAVWERIVSVEPVAEEDVYDVEIEGTHNFIGNDIVAHNTAFVVQQTSGNVGIGTTSPYSLLSISNSATTAANTPLFTIASTTSGTATSTLMTVLASGNVGIGTMAPQYKLDVALALDSFAAIGAPLGTGNYSGIRLGSNNAAYPDLYNKAGIVFERTDASVRGKLHILMDNSTDTGSAVLSDSIATFQANGNVGIGTTTPGATLEVAGNIHLSAIAGSSARRIDVDSDNDQIGIGGGITSNYGQLQMFGSGYTNYAGSTWIDAGNVETSGTYDGQIKLRTGGAQVMTITKGGNVGIGTTSPATLLHLNSTSGSILRLERNDTSVSTDEILGSVEFYSNDASAGNTNVRAKIQAVGEDTSGDNIGLAFYAATGGSVASERVRITGGGKVGIGTTTPTSLLQVAGATAPKITITDTNATTDNKHWFMESDTGQFSIGTTSDALATNATYRPFVIESGGNVGIGDMGPASPLTVNGKQDGGTLNGGSVEGVASFRGNTANNGVLIGATTDGHVVFTTTAASKDLIFARWSGGGINTETMRLQGSAGKVGIGTTTPVSTLSVQGSLCVRNTGSCGTTAGTIYATTGAISDIDLAENYQTTDASLSAGEIVAFDEANPTFVKRASGASASYLGVVSTAPGLLLGKELVNSKPVALSGRVPVKVNMDGGLIAVGDAITISSTTPGVGAKATASGETIGIALESASAAGIIEVFIKPEYTFAPSQLTIDPVTGNVGVGTPTPQHTLDVVGEVGAIGFVNTSTRSLKRDIEYATASSTEGMLSQLVNLKVATYRYTIESQADPLRIGLIAEDTEAIAPEILSADGKGVDLYKLATFTLSGVQALAAKFASLETRVTALDERLTALESGAISTASGSPLSLSSSTLASALEGFGVLIRQGIAQFQTLVFRQLVASSDADGTSSAGSVALLAGNTVAQVANSLVLPSTKVFVTFNSQITGSWWVSDKLAGSFRVVLSEAQAGDVSFDYFLVQTEGQIATSTPQNGTNGTYTTNGTNSATDTVAPTITLLGDNPLHLSVGGTFVEPGVSITDNADGVITAYVTYVNGIEGEAAAGTIDTGSEQTHLITYKATDARGNFATAVRYVIVGAADGAAAGSATNGTNGTDTTNGATAPTSEVGAPTGSVGDTTAPIVTLNGDAAMQLDVSQTYVEPGATATDDVDGSIAPVVTGTVDTATEGSYTLTYTATDAAGNTASVSRLVTVVAPAATEAPPAEPAA